MTKAAGLASVLPAQGSRSASGEQACEQAYKRRRVNLNKNQHQAVMPQAGDQIATTGVEAADAQLQSVVTTDGVWHVAGDAVSSDLGHTASSNKQTGVHASQGEHTRIQKPSFPVSGHNGSGHTPDNLCENCQACIDYYNLIEAWLSAGDNNTPASSSGYNIQIM